MLVTRGGDAGHGGHRREPRARPPQEGRTEQKESALRPPPPADKCSASCLQRARNVHAPEERQPGRPPPPKPPAPQEGDEGGEETARGNWGGDTGGDDKADGRDRWQAEGAPGRLSPAQRLTSKVLAWGREEGESRGRARQAKRLEEQKRAREGGSPRVESGGGKGQHSGQGGGGMKGAQRKRWKGTQSKELESPPADRIGPT